MPNDTPADRNKTPIKKILSSILPETGSVLEIASGNGTHVVFFAKHFPNLTWQPSDPDAGARESVNEKITSNDEDDAFLKLVKDITSKGFVRSNYKDKLVDLSNVRINLKSKK